MPDDLLTAVLAERRMEREARKGKAFADREFWSLYITAVMARRQAVDAYLKENPEPEPAEADTIEMFG